MRIGKIIKQFALIITAGIILSSCNSGNGKKNAHSGVEYYRLLQFSETPYDIEKGTHQITHEEAKTVNNYKFTYDNGGRLISVEFNRNDALLDYGSLGGAARITYEYKGNRQIKIYFDRNGDRIESSGVFEAEYSLDDKGRRTALKFIGKDGSPVENRNKINSYKWSVLDNGMVRELRYNLAGEEVVLNPFCPFYELRFSYNDKGFMTRMANYKADTLYNCTAENCGDIGVSYFTFVPDDNGDVTQFSVFNVFGQMSNLYWGWSKRVTKFDRNGYALETEVFDQDNEYVSGKLIPIVQNDYDSHGALTESRNLDKNRNIINDSGDGTAFTRYTYDDKGNRTATVRYDKDKTEVKN
jgi:YD repeat-containing protein